MNTFSSKFQEIVMIMADPSSYIRTKSSDSDTNSFLSVINTFSKKYKQQNSTNQPIEQIHIITIADVLKNIIPPELKVDYTDLLDYFKMIQNFQSNPVCDCYVRDHDKLEEYTDDDVVKSSDLFMAFHCKTCKHFESDHKSCSKYISTDNYYCNICGLGKSSHTICMNYNGINDDCDTCGFSWYDHQNKYDNMMIEDCGNFIPHSECSDRCANCIFNNTHHKYTPKYHLLNTVMKSKISSLWFTISVDFISMSERDRLGLYNQYYSIAKMLTNHL